VLIAAVWLATALAVGLWFSGVRETRLALAGGPAGSESLALSQALADAVNTADAGLRIDVFESGGSSENVRLLENGRVDLGTLQADTPASDAVLGVTTLYSDAYHLVAHNEAGVDSFVDLRGRRVAIPPATSGEFGSFWFLADHYRIEPYELKALPMAEEAANFAMELGQVDAVFRVRAPGNLAIRAMIGDRDLHLVPIGQSEALSLKQPAITPGVIPTGSYRGHPALPAEDLPTAVIDRLLVARADLDRSVIYRLTREIYAQRAEIMEASPLAGFISPLPADEATVVNAHPGARSFFDREKPGFLQQNARLASAGLYVVVIVSSALLALRTAWVRSRRMRMHGFNRRLMEIAAGVREETAVGELLQRKQQLVDMLQEVVDELEREKVSQGEFEHFSFTWQAVDALIRDRIHLRDALADSDGVAP
jgi:TRAP transporter TAXI family solute receptor